MMKQIVAVVVALLLFCPASGFSETKEIVAEGTYNMGDGETPTVAESRALLQAKRTAVEEAGTYVESYSKTRNFQLTVDEIQVLASGVMEVEVLEKKRTIVGDGFNFWVKIKAKVSTDKMEEMAKRVKEKSVVEDYKKIQEAYKNSLKEIEELKKQLHKATSEYDRAIAVKKIKNSEDQYNSLKDLEKNIYSRLIATDTVLNIIDQKKSQTEIANDLIAKIADGIHIDVGNPDIILNPDTRYIRVDKRYQNLTDQEIADMTMVSLPLTISHSDTVWENIDSTIMRIGGRKKKVDLIKYLSWEKVGKRIAFQIGENYDTIMAFQRNIQRLRIIIEFFSNEGLIDRCQIEPDPSSLPSFDSYPVIRVSSLRYGKAVYNYDLNKESCELTSSSCNFDSEEYTLISDRPIIINAKLYMRLEDTKSLQKINAIIKQAPPREQRSAEEKRCMCELGSRL